MGKIKREGISFRKKHNVTFRGPNLGVRRPAVSVRNVYGEEKIIVKMPKRKVSHIRNEIRTLKKKLEEAAGKNNIKQVNRRKLLIAEKQNEIKNRKANRKEAAKLEREWQSSQEYWLQKATELNLLPGMYTIVGGGKLEKKYCVQRLDSGKEGEKLRFSVMLIGPDKTGYDHYWIGERIGPNDYPRRSNWYRNLDDQKRYEIEKTKKLEEARQAAKEGKPVRLGDILDDRILTHSGKPIVLVEGEDKETREHRKRINKRFIRR